MRERVRWVWGSVVLLVACGGERVDTDPSGQGGAKGACGPMAGELETIYQAPPMGGRGAGNLVLDDQDVYFTSHGDDAIVRIPKSSGTPQKLPFGSLATALAIDEQYLYWDDANKISRTPKIGGETLVLATRDHVAISFAIDSTKLYWLTSSAFATPTAYVERAAKDTPGATTIATGYGFEQLAIGGGLGYFTAILPSSVAPFPGVIQRFSTQSGPADTIISDTEPQAIAADETAAYFSAAPDATTSYPTTIWKVVHGTEDAHPIVKHDSFIRAMAVDEACIYFADSDSIQRVPKSGGAPVRLAPTTTYVNVVAVDSSGVYWSETDIDRVQRIRK